MVCSMKDNLARDERLMHFLVGLRREENHRFCLLPPPLLNSFDMGAPGNTKKLLDHSMVQGVALIGGVFSISSGLGSLWLR
jgi:hypothetical protein